jgi:hypothetical protein
MLCKIETINPRICSFYENNPSLNFDSMNMIFIELIEKLLVDNNNNINSSIESHILSNLSQNASIIVDLKTTVSSLKDAVNNLNTENLHEIQANNTKLITEIGDLIVNTRPSSPTNIDNTKQLSVVLNKIFNTSEILPLKEYTESHIFLMKRFQKPKILIETKDSDSNISMNEIAEFMKIVEEKNTNGIFVSQNSGFSTKSNYHIDYSHGNIVVFIHNGEYCHAKIKIAVDIIYNLYSKLKEFNNATDDNTIPKSILDDINKEYQLFISQKEAVINVYKDCQKKVLSQIDEIRFPCLDKYLSTKYTNPVTKQGFKCDLCKCFNANNLKALAAHKRGCARKNVFVNVSQKN